MERGAPSPAVTTRLRVPTDALSAASFIASGADRHYLHRVLRLQIGDRIVGFDGFGRERDGAIAATRDIVEIQWQGSVRSIPPEPVQWMALLPLIKGERMERCLSQLTELGVDEIRLYRAARSVVKLEPKKVPAKLERYQKIVTAAAAQCQRSTVPRVLGFLDLSDALLLPNDSLGLVFWEERNQLPLPEQIPAPVPKTIAILTGPEGGLEAVEVETAVAAGFRTAGLGPRFLRADTAPVAALAMLQYHALEHARVPPDASD
jgi:16S rRNA (uracil1498-N3)-methyltransferase